MSIKNISDLKVRGEGGGASPGNMVTMCFHSLENVTFKPLLQLGSIYQMVEILHYVCSSLWNISLLLGTSFSLDSGIFCHSATCCVIMFIAFCYMDIM